MKCTVRKMKDEDIEQVQQVAKITWNATYEGIIPIEIQENFLKSAYNSEMMKRRLNQSLMIVAECEDKIVGFVNFSQVKNEGKVELAAIYIYPEYQGKGIGSALFVEGIKHLEGAKEIYVNVEKDNEIGLKFYSAKGFSIINEFDDDFEGHMLKTTRMVLYL